MKRLLVGLVIFVALSVGVISVGVPAATTYACSPAAGNCTGTCAPHKFLTLVPWYQYLDLSEGAECNVNFTLLPDGGKPSSIPLVLLAVLEDMVRIAGLVAVVFVIWGGVRYITSEGTPDGTKQAKSTIMNALIGLAIAVIATSAVAFIGRKLAGG